MTNVQEEHRNVMEVDAYPQTCSVLSHPRHAESEFADHFDTRRQPTGLQKSGSIDGRVAPVQRADLSCQGSTRAVRFQNDTSISLPDRRVVSPLRNRIGLMTVRSRNHLYGL
jgi:hypothetical protein